MLITWPAFNGNHSEKKPTGEEHVDHASGRHTFPLHTQTLLSSPKSGSMASSAWEALRAAWGAQRSIRKDAPVVPRISPRRF